MGLPRMLKFPRKFLIVVVIVYSCIILYLLDATSQARHRTKTAEHLFDRSSSFAPNHKLVLMNRYAERKRGRREIYDYRDSDTKHGNTIDSGKEILLLMDTQ